MKKIIPIFILLFLNINILSAYNINLYGELTDFEKKVISLGDNTCKDFQERDIPVIFIPGVLVSWYKEEGLDDNKIKLLKKIDGVNCNIYKI